MINELEAGESLFDEMKQKYPAVYAGFNQIEMEQLTMFCRKHLDYGMKNVAAGTDLKTAAEVEFALQGLWFRISDKVNRWQNIMLSGETHVKGESLLDTFQDIAIYAILAQMVGRGMWKAGDIDEKNSEKSSRD